MKTPYFNIIAVSHVILIVGFIVFDVLFVHSGMMTIGMAIFSGIMTTALLSASLMFGYVIDKYDLTLGPG